MNESDAILSNIRQITNRLQARLERVQETKEKTQGSGPLHSYSDLCGREWELTLVIGVLETLLKHWNER